VNKPLLQRFWEWFTTTPTTTAYDDANDATRLVADDPVVIPLPPPQHMRDVAGVAHARLVDIQKRKPARRKTQAQKLADVQAALTKARRGKGVFGQGPAPKKPRP
jgi:hypothetical protein